MASAIEEYHALWSSANVQLTSVPSARITSAPPSTVPSRSAGTPRHCSSESTAEAFVADVEMTMRDCDSLKSFVRAQACGAEIDFSADLLAA